VDNSNLTLIGASLIIVVLYFGFVTHYLTSRMASLQRSIDRLERRLTPDDDDALPWEPGDYVEGLTIDERDFG